MPPPTLPAAYPTPIPPPPPAAPPTTTFTPITHFTATKPDGVDIIQVWKSVWTALAPLHDERVATEILELQRFLPLSHEEIPQLRQLNKQLSNAAGQLPWLSDSAGLQSLVVILLTAVFATSTVSGIQKGIKWLSELNVWLTLTMAAGLLLLGPGIWLIQHFFSGFFTYLIHLPQMALTPNAIADNWVNGWTVFYWGWFLGYAPLMAIFVARISRGRSIREMILAVAVLAPIATTVWFTLLGGSGIYYQLTGVIDLTEALNNFQFDVATLTVAQALPGGTWMALAILLLTTIFVATTGDSMTYSLSVSLSRSDRPSTAMRVFWGGAMGAMALVLVSLGSGGIGKLQSFIVVTAVPVSLVLLPSLWDAVRITLARSPAR